MDLTLCMMNNQRRIHCLLITSMDCLHAGSITKDTEKSFTFPSASVISPHCVRVTHQHIINLVTQTCCSLHSLHQRIVNLSAHDSCLSVHYEYTHIT